MTGDTRLANVLDNSDIALPHSQQEALFGNRHIQKELQDRHGNDKDSTGFPFGSQEVSVEIPSPESRRWSNGMESSQFGVVGNITTQELGELDEEDPDITTLSIQGSSTQIDHSANDAERKFQGMDTIKEKSHLYSHDDHGGYDNDNSKSFGDNYNDTQRISPAKIGMDSLAETQKIENNKNIKVQDSPERDEVKEDVDQISKKVFQKQSSIQDLADTQPIAEPSKLNLDLADTQPLVGSRQTNLDLTDTQPIARLYQTNLDLADTQVIDQKRIRKPAGTSISASTEDDFDISPDTQFDEGDDHNDVDVVDDIDIDIDVKANDELKETQVINRKEEKISHVPQYTSQDSDYSFGFIDRLESLPETQVITNGNLIDHRFNRNHPNLKSRRQVINTQDVPDGGSQGTNANGIVEVQTDDERDITYDRERDEEQEEEEKEEKVDQQEDEDLVMEKGKKESEELDVPVDKDVTDQYEDSIVRYRKRNLSKSPIKLKRARTENLTSHFQSNEDENADYLTPAPVLRNHSVPLILASPFDKIFTSSSSPSKKIANQLVMTDEDGKLAVINTSMLNDNGEKNQVLDKVESSHSGDNNSNNGYATSPPSSPEAILLTAVDETDVEKMENSLNDIVPDVDMDVDNSAEKSSLEKPARSKRRVNRVVESQSGTDDATTNDIDNDVNDGEYIINGVLRKEKSDTLRESDILYRDSVWATYNLKMYTGRLEARYSDSLIVEFQDGSYSIKNEDLNMLDLRIGDTVNVRGKRFKCIVVGLSRGDSSVNAFKCMRGYSVVHVVKRSQKSNADRQEFLVPLSECLMELSDWMIHEQKYRLLFGDENNVGDKSNDVILLSSNGLVRSRGTTFDVISGASHQQNYHQQPLTPTKASTRISSEKFLKLATPSPKKSLAYGSTSLIFAGKLFSITNIDGARKELIKQKIESNGGIYLDSDLLGIFEYSKDDDNGLGLTSKYLKQSVNIRFGCMIANNFCRSSKYLQALALGWPILSDAYIDDVIANPSRVDDWYVYLLPAGYSIHMQAMKSLDIYKYRVNFELGLLLNEQILNRKLLLTGVNILILSFSVTESKKNLIELETSKFIFHAFGAQSWNICHSVEKAVEAIKSFISMDQEFLIFNDGGANDILDKILTSFNEQENSFAIERGRSQGSRRSKRGERRDEKEQHDIRVVDWEWVVQCVISGCIWDSPSTTITTTTLSLAS